MSKSDLPEIAIRECSGISFFTDDALFERTGVRIAFTTRHGGNSQGDYSGLNLGSHVGDDADTVLANRRLLLDALDANPDMSLICPNQVHGSNVVIVSTSNQDRVDRANAQAREGADAITIGCADVAALLCFADCLPLILVAPTGEFSVIHAGWRGTVAHIASIAARSLCDLAKCDASLINAYIGPHIGFECFEVRPDTLRIFENEFPTCAHEICLDGDKVSLSRAVKCDLELTGLSPSRISDIRKCTFCNNGDFYSYRAQSGQCGRHGAVAFRS